MREGRVRSIRPNISYEQRRSTVAEAMPAITQVAVTVSDLAVSEPWYTKVLGAEPVLDEDTGPFRHIVYSVGGTLLGLHDFPDLDRKSTRLNSSHQIISYAVF